MKALCWHGIGDLRVERVPDPVLVNPQDVIVKVALSSVSGADLSLLDDHEPSMRPGDIIGHEFLGEIVEKGPEVRHLNRGDRIVVPSVIACGHCGPCKAGDFPLCDNSNPNPEAARAGHGPGGAGVFGCGHASGGYAGSHAEYVRVPYADVNGVRVPEGVTDAQAVFVSDAAPAGWTAAEMAGIRPGDVVAVWGCGGVGQMAMRAAALLGAGRVIGIDHVPDRLRAAQMKAGAEPLDHTRVDLFDALQSMTGGRGPDVCIDAVGAGDGHPPVLRRMIECCRKGGTLSVVGLHHGVAGGALAGALAGAMDGFPLGVAMTKGLSLRMGRPNGRRHAERLFGHIVRGELDPSYLMTHRRPLDDGPQGYRMFKDKADGCLRVVFAPHS